MLKMRRLINNWSLSVFFLFILIKFLQFLRWLGIQSEDDGWRKVTRVYLRTEQSKFVLGCFGLNFQTQDAEEIIKRLQEFFRGQPQTHWQLKWGHFSTRRITKSNIDMVKAEFKEDGSLQFIHPYFDSLAKVGTQIFDQIFQNTLAEGIINAYNNTRHLSDKKRPLILKKELKKWLSAQLHSAPRNVKRKATDYIQRVLNAIFIHFEENNSWKGPFDMPVFIKHKHPGFGPFNIICRLSTPGNKADLWIQSHHICIDGLPMQEILEELKTQWGEKSALKFPSHSNIKVNSPELCSTYDERNGVYCISKIVNFRPLLDMAAAMNKDHLSQMKRCITTLRLLIWKLGNHPFFSGKKFLIPVNIPPDNNLERTLGFVLIRPSEYFDKNDTKNGFIEFQQEFNRQVKSTIMRKSKSYELFASYALLPAVIYTIVLKLMPAGVKEFVGSIGISVINKSDVFIAPFSDVHTDGFIGISNFFTPTDDDKIGCFVSIKGPKNIIKDYLNAIEEIATLKAE
ncbi:MAG: hypothetical protein Q8N49_00540 [Candidatus Omnitrophota bacterium]|nr:hypothetical protein [Candidatus Omnitrophota bacterium]